MIPIAAPGRYVNTPAMRDAVVDALASAQYVDGGLLARFEQQFADYVCASHCVGVGNGTDALEIALRSVGVGPGDRVVTVANAGFYASAAILATGAVPRYVDVDPDSFLMAVDGLASALESKPAAVVLTHLYGDTSAGPAVETLCRAAGVPLVLDCAQACGRDALRNATLAAFSFYPTKNLPCAGDGGAVVTDDSALATRARQLSRYGWGSRFEVCLSGGRNSRLDDVQAALLSAGLPQLDRRNRRRQQIRSQLLQAVTDSPWRAVGGTTDHLAHLAVFQGPDVPRLRAHLAQAGVATDVYYPIPDHKQHVMAGAAVTLPVTESLVGHHVALPCFPELRDEEVALVVRTLSGACHG